VRQVDRQERAPRCLIERARERDVVLGDPVGLGRIGDALAEAVDRAREPVGGETMRAGESVLQTEPGDVAAGQPVGAPLAAGECAHRTLAPRARRECEQQTPTSGRN
jgi:hypothetical protein